MYARKHDTRWMVCVALLAAIVVALAMSPFGMIQLPFLKATTVHIPVIIGAALLGPEAGAILGAVFGVCSVISNTLAPTLLSFAFSPFFTITGLTGALKALWVSVGCRILVGLTVSGLWILLARRQVRRGLALLLVGAFGSLTNTGTVLFSIGVLFLSPYAAAQNGGMTGVFGLLMGTMTASGIPEAVAAAILVPILGRALIRLSVRMDLPIVRVRDEEKK